MRCLFITMLISQIISRLMSAIKAGNDDKIYVWNPYVPKMRTTVTKKVIICLKLNEKIH